MTQSLMRNLYYEAKPFACVALGLYAISLPYMGTAGKVAGLVLIGCSVSIIYMRARFRGLLR